jgi:glutaconate CoA-transferase subunit A
MHRKVMSMAAAAELVKNGQMLALGGNALHRTPAAYAHTLAGLKRSNLKIAGAAPGYAADVLCAAGAVDTVYFGFFGFENEYGLAAGFRKGSQEGRIKAIEGS